MMTIESVLDFYYSVAPVINLRVEMNGGIKGKDHVFTHKEAADFLRGYENEKVICTYFETHFFFKGEAVDRREIPALFIKYM